MFEHLLSRIKQIPVSPSDLKQVVSVDKKTGENVTLEDLLPDNATQNSATQTASAFGFAAAKNNPEPKPVRELDESEMRRIVDAFLDSIPKSEALEIEGYGSFTADQLRDEVERGTVVGRRITEIVRQDSIFLEEAVKQQKIARQSTGPIHIPDFDF